MDSKVFETIYATGTLGLHKYEIHQFVQWYGYLPYWMQGKSGPIWDDWYLVRHSIPTNHHVGTPRWNSKEGEEMRIKMNEKPAVLYKRDEAIGYMVYRDGVPTTDIPTVGDYSIPKDVKLEEVNTFWDYRNRTFKRSFEDPIKIWNTKEYEKLFTPKYKVGDTVFCVTYHDRDTRCGERYQVEHMKIEKISIDMGRILYYNNDDNFFSINHICEPQSRVSDNVEELIKKFEKRGERLYMWNPEARLGIVECKSTKQYKNAWMK